MTAGVMARPECSEPVDELVIRARLDGEALGVLYERYYDRIFRYCLRRLFVPEVAEDVTSAVFCQMAGHISAFQGRSERAFRGWLYAIASNQANSHIRKTARRRELMEAAMRQRAGEIAAGQADDERAARELDWPTVYGAIAELNIRQQTIIALRFFEQMSFSEIAEILGCKPVTARVTCGRALAILRKKLTRPPAGRNDG